MRTGVEGYGVVVWFGKYTDIASLVLLFGFTQPIAPPKVLLRKKALQCLFERAQVLFCE